MTPTRVSAIAPSQARSSTPADSAGFTLIEVLVALVIAGLALGALFEGAAGGLRASRDARRVTEALSLARSHLAVLGTGDLAARVLSGDDGDGFRWRGGVTALATVPVGDPGHGLEGQTPRLGLFAINVRIEWNEDGGTRHVSLRSERLALAPPPPS